MDLASRFGSASAAGHRVAPRDDAGGQVLELQARRGLTGEAMEVFGGNGYVETGPMGRLFREAPVNSIWEGSGNVMCLDVLRAISRNPGDAELVLDCLQEVATQAPPVLAQVSKLRDAIVQPSDVLEREARRFTQRLALVSQACLMLRHAGADESAAFVGSRFDPDWGPVAGVGSGTEQPGRAAAGGVGTWEIVSAERYAAFAALPFGRPVFRLGTPLRAARNARSLMPLRTAMPARRSSLFLVGRVRPAARSFRPSSTAYSDFGIVKLSRTSSDFASVAFGATATAALAAWARAGARRARPSGPTAPCDPLRGGGRDGCTGLAGLLLVGHRSHHLYGIYSLYRSC